MHGIYVPVIQAYLLRSTIRLAVCYSNRLADFPVVSRRKTCFNRRRLECISNCPRA